MLHRTRVAGLLALVTLPLLAATQAIAVAPLQASNGIEKYLGKWNYTQPDQATMTNIAVVTPGTLRAPQVGDIVFTAQGTDTVVGRTDVGCTWTFRPGGGALHLDPASQTCHNPTFDAWYTISTWTVTVTGQHETETIKATSPSPFGTFTWALDNGARMKTSEFDPPSARRFLGTWQYDPADPATGQNIRVTRSVGPDGKPMIIQTYEQGPITVTADFGNRITARTPDGCTWTLLTRANTAHLDPATQTCMTSATTDVALRYWAIASDGHQQASSMAGVDSQGHAFAIGSGSLTEH